MKNIKLFSAALFTLLLFAVLPLQAYHLDGLWRNDRQNITLRIESAEDGFRAKRIDQGVWDKYQTKNGYRFLDRFGNAYIVKSDQEIIWHEAGSGKKLYFSKIDNRNGEGREYKEKKNRNGRQFENKGRKHWKDSPDHLNGIWIDSNSDEEIQIESFKDEIRLKRAHSGWQKYYPGQYGQIYTDKNGNTIQLMGNDSIRWENRNGKNDKMYYRASDYRHGKGRNK